MAKQNPINNQTPELTIDHGVVGDSFVQFDISTVNKFRIGVDDSDGDKFKISVGNALGTNDTMTITSDGEVRLPLQPAFDVIQIGAVSNVTGDGTVYVTPATTVIFDQGSNYSSPTFTAPVTGKYFFGSAETFIQFDTTTGGAEFYTAFVTSNRIYYGNNFPGRKRNNGFWGPNLYIQSPFCCFSDMDFGDTCHVVLVSLAGAKNDNSPRRGFGGFLVM